MTTYKITLRQISDAENLQDMRFLGEIYYDVIEGRLCICNGPDVITYPSIDLDQTKMVIPQGFSLTGYANDHIQMRWNEPQTLNIIDSVSGLSPLKVTLSQQIVRPAMDALYNRTAPLTLETFYAMRAETDFNIVYSSSKKTYRTPGNLWLEQGKLSTRFQGTFSPLNYNGDAHFRTIRNKNDANYSPHLYPRGRTSLLSNTKSIYFTGLTLKSRMYYPSAGEQDITFFMLVDIVNTPTRFITRIGWEGNWQVFNSVLTTDKALAFHFRAADVLPINRGKPIEVEWITSLTCGYNIGTQVQRGVHVSCLTALPGYVEAKDINPAFTELGVENNALMMYGSDVRTQYMTGREESYVNFPVPMIDNSYTIQTELSPHVIEYVSRSRYGFVCRSLQASPGSRWKFSYSTRM